MLETRVLQSWKEIARYLNRGVRTVQRWEQGFGLPIHRPAGRDRSAVLAIPEELDSWLANCPKRSPQERNNVYEQLQHLRRENERLTAELNQLRTQTRASSQLSNAA